MSDEAVENDNLVESNGENVLFAGKFKNVEDLEKAYKEGFGVHQKNKELEAKINEYVSPPEDYLVQDGITVKESRIEDVKKLAKSAKMTQSQFENAISKAQEEHSQYEENINSKIAEIGESKSNILKGYIDKKFSSFDDEFKNAVMRKAVENETIMENMMRDREKELNSNAPGISNTASSNSSRQQDMSREKYEAALKCKMDPRDKVAKQKYINLCRDIGYAKMESQK